jgi:hypothetical protein
MNRLPSPLPSMPNVPPVVMLLLVVDVLITVVTVGMIPLPAPEAHRRLETPPILLRIICIIIIVSSLSRLTCSCMYTVQYHPTVQYYCISNLA